MFNLIPSDANDPQGLMHCQASNKQNNRIGVDFLRLFKAPTCQQDVITLQHKVCLCHCFLPLISHSAAMFGSTVTMGQYKKLKHGIFAWLSPTMTQGWGKYGYE